MSVLVYRRADCHVAEVRDDGYKPLSRRACIEVSVSAYHSVAWGAFFYGEKLTADDVIFSMYVLCDPTYDGSSTLYSQKIVGMEDYRSGMETRFNLIWKTERAGYTANDYFTEEDYNIGLAYLKTCYGADAYSNEELIAAF